MSTPDQRTRHVVFVDVETNGLDPRVHDTWEVAWWNLSTGDRGRFFPYLRDVGAFLAASQFEALRVNRFIDRFGTDDYAPHGQKDMEDALHALSAQIEPGDRPPSVVAAANPAFDIAFLDKLWRRSEWLDVPKRHHRLMDVEAIAVGTFPDFHPWDPPGLRTIAARCQAPAPDHTATGDVTSGGVSLAVMTGFRHYREAHWNERVTVENYLAILAQPTDDSDANPVLPHHVKGIFPSE